jgi:hypothetical protein
VFPTDGEHMTSMGTSIVCTLATLAQIILFLKILKFSIPPPLFLRTFFNEGKGKIFLKYFVSEIKISKLVHYSTNMC